MKSKHGKTPQAQGFGESKLHIAEEGHFPPNPILSCHMGGELIANFPQHVINRIVYAQTDEGLAEREEELRAKGRLKEPGEPRVEFGRTDWDGEIEAYGEAEDPSAADPFASLMKKHVSPGFCGKMMSKDAIKRRGMRGYRTVPGPDGQPVEMGNMILGEIPKDLREQRKMRARQADREQLSAPVEQYKQAEEQSFSQAGIPLAAARRASAFVGPRAGELGAGLQDDFVNANET